MSIYKTLFEKSEKFLGRDKMFKIGFNLSPMYRRSTGRIVSVSKDVMQVRMRLKISWKNRNYMNSIFGGSLFSAVDPIPMIQLTWILGADYVVWDKSAEIAFKRPAKEDLFADFIFTTEEIAEIKKRVSEEKEIVIHKLTQLKGKANDVVYCEVVKFIYIADKSHHKQKLEVRKLAKS